MENKDYGPLPASDSFDTESTYLEYHVQAPPRDVRTLVVAWLASALCLVLAFSNVLLVLEKFNQNVIPIVGPQYSGVERTSQLQTLYWTTEYSEFNSTAADHLWKELRPAFGLVALDHGWASKHGLPRSQDFQGDRSKGIYMIDAYHQMHCLQMLRTSLQEVAKDLPQSTPLEHKFHCLDSLRQSVMCRADDTPLYTLGDFRSGDGQLRSCRDWELLSRWASERFPFSSSEQPS
ncbi:hypothetical protein ACMFMG_001155 [Clarireedia jacksonii]